ncbi:nucleoside 2-deoxyribosyltransferase [Isosphaeraceae bacterium EP7]
MQLYFAGPLFTQAERTWNALMAAELSAAGHSVFLPQVEVKAIASLEADAIFRVDIDGVRRADALVAILDGADADSGTCFECGVAYALGIPIVLVRTDFRGGGDALPGQAVCSLNLMLSQAASEVVHLPDPGTRFEDVARAILEALNSVPASVEPIGRAAKP